MSHRSSDSAYPGAWEPQGYAKSSNGCTQGVIGYHSRTGQAYTQSDTNTTYYQRQHGGVEAAQYSYSQPDVGALYRQNAAMSTGAYPGQTATNNYDVTYQSSAYNNSIPQYGQQ